MGLGEISLGEMGLGEMGLGEMGQNPFSNYKATKSDKTFSVISL